MTQNPRSQESVIFNQRVPDVRDPVVAERLKQALPAAIKMLDNMQVSQEQQAVLLDMDLENVKKAA